MAPMIKLHHFVVAAALVVCIPVAAALLPAAIIPGGVGVVLTVILLVLQCVVLSVPNVAVHLTRRLTVHHRGSSCVVYYSIATGEAGLRQRLCSAFENQTAIEPSSIEGLEHPRGSGVVYPLSLVSAAVDSLLGSDCELALLRPEPSVTRFHWEDLQQGNLVSPEQKHQQQSFARCLAARGYCTVRMPRERLNATTTMFDQAEQFFSQSAASKATHRYGTIFDELKHGWFAEPNREYFEVHRPICSTSNSLGHVGDLPYPSEDFRNAAEETFANLEEVAHASLKLLLPGENGRCYVASDVAGDVDSWTSGDSKAATNEKESWVATSAETMSSNIYKMSDDDLSDSESQRLLDASHVALDSQGVAMSYAAVRRCLMDGVPISVEEGPQDSHGVSQLSTSMFRVHQYNSTDESLHGGLSVTRLILALRQQLQQLFRRLPFYAIVAALISGTTAGTSSRNSVLDEHSEPQSQAEFVRMVGIPGLHADLGLITVAPKSSAAGLLICCLENCTSCYLDSRGRWKLVEAEMEQDDVVVFAGYTLGWITRGAYRPLLHGVRTMALRRSLIFFLRAWADAPIARCRSVQSDRPEARDELVGITEGSDSHLPKPRGIDVEGVHSSAGELQRDFNALRVERRIPIVVLRPLYRFLHYNIPWMHHNEAGLTTH